MTLGRLVLAWLPVTLWFALVPVARSALASKGSQLTPGASPGMPLTWPSRRDVGWRAAEAGVLTLFASLWFDSLGRGGWWLLFLLVGLLAGFAARLPDRGGDAPGLGRAAIVDGLIDTGRYVIAGAILAWSLG